MVLDHVESSSHRWQPVQPVQPNHTTAQRRQRQGTEEPARAAVLRLGVLATPSKEK